MDSKFSISYLQSVLYVQVVSFLRYWAYLKMNYTFQWATFSGRYMTQKTRKPWLPYFAELPILNDFEKAKLFE